MNRFKSGQRVRVLVEPRGSDYATVVAYEKTLIGDLVRVTYDNGMPDGLFRENLLKLVSKNGK